MTAGQPEGVGQQQGQPMTLREEFACRTCGHMHDTDRSCMSNGISESEYCNCDDGEPRPSPTPPARDSGRDEAREAVARWLATFAGKSWPRRSETEREQMRGEVDFLLETHGSELNKLLRRPA